MQRAAWCIGAFVVVAVAATAGCGESYAEETVPSNDAGADADGGRDGGDAGTGGDAIAAGPEIRTPVTPLSFVVKRVFIGDVDRDGTGSPNAWELFGRNIDGITTTEGSQNGECKPREDASPSLRVDGAGGVDNSFGKNILSFLQAFSSHPTEDANAAIAKGVRTPMFALDGNGGFFVYAEETGTTPTFALSETRLVAAEWTEDAPARRARSSEEAPRAMGSTSRATSSGRRRSSSSSARCRRNRSPSAPRAFA